MFIFFPPDLVLCQAFPKWITHTQAQQTLLVGACDFFCSIAFHGAKENWMGAQGQKGLHRSSF